MGRMFFSYKEVVLQMNKKILSILTGVSALAVAGLLSIIPASVSHAAPSQPVSPATYNATSTVNVTVLDGRATASPNPTYVTGTVDWTVTGVERFTSISNYISAAFEIYTDSDQHFEISPSDVELSAYNCLDAYVNASFHFTYDGTTYAGDVIASCTPMSSGYRGGLSVSSYRNFAVPATSSSSSSTTASGSVPSEGDPAAKAFNEAIDNTVNAIGLAIQGLNADGTVNEARTVEYKSSGAISPKIIYALAHAENVTLIYTFEYEGIIFQSAITSEAAAAMYSPTIPWYGPCYIATFCPPIPIGFVQ